MTVKKWLLGTSCMAVSCFLIVLFSLLKPPAGTPGNAASGPDTSGSALAPDSPEPAVPVKVAEARCGDLVTHLRSPGEVVAERRIILRTEMAGVLRELPVKEGLRVQAGSLIAVLDDQRYRLALERQEASRLRLLSETLLDEKFGRFANGLALPRGPAAGAKEELASAEASFRQGLISRAEFEKASANYERSLIESGMRKDEVRGAARGLTQAEIDVKTARLDLAQTVTRAPFAGIVTDIKVSPGEHLEPGREVCTLVDVRAIKVIVRVLESEIGKVGPGRTAALRFSAFPDRVFPGVVTAVSPVVSAEDKTCAVHVIVGNPREEIKPGMYAEAELAAEVHRHRLLVPQAAVLGRGGRKLVFVVEDGSAQWRYVEVGLENETYAEILEGVSEGDRVAVDGHFTLAHAARVTVVE